MAIKAEFICLEEPAFFALMDRVVKHLEEKHNEDSSRWITKEDAMKRLAIGKSSLQKYRDEGRIKFFQDGKKILYDKFSIDDYLLNNSD